MALDFRTGAQAGDGTPARSPSGDSGQGVSEREDLANYISMITRDETPFMSSIGKTKASAIYHEWQTDELAVPYLNGAGEGETFTSADSAQFNEPLRTRLGNYTQISRKTLDISGTKRAVDQAGVADEYAYQLKKRGTELRRDLELSLIHTNQVADGTGTRRFGGVQSFIDNGNVVRTNNAAYVLPTTNAATGRAAGDVVRGTTGIAGTGGTATNPSYGGVNTTGINTRTIQLTDIDSSMQTIYEEGGKATKIMVSPKGRRDISSQAQSGGTGGTENVRRNIDSSGSLRQSVDVYMSDFGELMVVPNYVMGLGTLDARADDATGRPAGVNATAPEALTNTANFFAFVYDPMWFSIATLRPLQEIDLGQQGDTTIGQIVEECTLEVRNPKGFGLIAGLQ